MTPPPTPPLTARAAWPACWPACGRRARASRSPRWPAGPPPTPLDDPAALVVLLKSLQRAGAGEQAAALLAREPAAHAPLDDPVAVANLLHSLRAAGAGEQAAALAARAAVYAPLDSARGVPWLLDSLREAGAREQAAVLTARLPMVGMSSSFSRRKASRISSASDGRPTAPGGAMGLGRAGLMACSPAADRRHWRSAEQGAT